MTQDRHDPTAQPQSATDAAPQRRRLLQAGAALGLAGMTGPWLAGCATAGGSGNAKLGHVVVIGGGYGGATAARYLKLWGGNDVAVTLIERQPQFISCPISNLVIGGFREMASITRGYEGLQSMGVKVVQGEVQAIDAAGKSVRLVDGSSHRYDRLVLSPGIDFIDGAIGGLERALASGNAVHAWKAGPQTVALRQQLTAMADGGVFAMTIPKAPYRCPPGPYERACMVAAYLKEHKPKSKVLVLDANPEIQSKKALFEKAFAQHYAGILEYRPNAELKEIDGKTAKLEFEDVKADVLNVIPPQRAANLARDAGLININQRWVGVDWLSMEATAAPNIHVLGDAVFPGPLMPKSGHMANQHAKLAVAAILQKLKGEAVNPNPVVMNTCYSFVTARDVIHVASVHQYDAESKGFKTVPGSGGVSAAANQVEGKLALSWADNIWNDMLAKA